MECRIDQKAIWPSELAVQRTLGIGAERWEAAVKQCVVYLANCTSEKERPAWVEE